MIKINGNVTKINMFPDETPRIKLSAEDLRPNPDGITNISWHYESMEEMFSVIALVNHFYNLRNTVNLFLPYVPNARMDRTENVSEVFTLKWFADIINYLPINQLKIFDPHSHVTEALFDRCVIMDPREYVEEVITKRIPDTFEIEIDTFFFPDEGAMKRYSKILNTRPFTFGMKNRNWSTGEIKSLEVVGDLNNVESKNILIVDDICSKGGTFYFASKRLKELGANKIFLYVSHCEDTLITPIINTEMHQVSYSIDKYDGLIDRVYTTNSIITMDHEKVEVIEL